MPCPATKLSISVPPLWGPGGSDSGHGPVKRNSKKAKGLFMMRKLLASCLVWTVLVTGVGAKDAGFFLHDGDRVVFLGDSITEQKLYTTYIEAYALTRFPQAKFTFRNVGWGGDTAWLRQRTHADEGKLFAAKPEEQQKMVEKAVDAGLGAMCCPSNRPP